MLPMTAAEVKSFIGRTHDLPTLPVLLGKIVAVINDEKASQEEIYSLIFHDQTLAEKVLRTANSVFFGHAGQVKDLEQAVMLLGDERIKAMALGMTVMEMFPARTSFNVKNLWIHSYEVAFIAAALSDLIPMTSQRESFLSGLLHDLGRIIFYKLDHVKFLEIETTDNMLEREFSFFGCTHAEAGAWFAEETGMPAEIVAALRHHHAPSGSEDYKDAVSIVALAEALSRRFSPRIEDDGLWTREHDVILLEYALTEEALVTIGQNFNEVREDIDNFFSLL